MTPSKYLLLSFIFSMFFVVGCDNDKKNTSPTTPNKKSVEDIREENRDYTGLRNLALSTITFRMQGKEDQLASTSIEADIWHYEFVFDGKTMAAPQPHDGYWLDLKPDWTYEYGRYGEKEGSGRYHYSFENSTLLMVDDSPSVKPDEYEVKLAGDSLVLVGKGNFESNSKQCKLFRSPNYPTK